MANRNELASRPNRRMRAQVLAEDDTCILCGHPGSDAVDHIIPIARGGTEDRENKAPIHGVNGCPTCLRKCNSEKGDKPLPEVKLITSRDWYSPLPG